MFCKYFTHLATLCQATVHFITRPNISRALQDMAKYLPSSNTLFDGQSTSTFESRPQILKRRSKYCILMLYSLHFQLHLAQEILKNFHTRRRCLCYDTLYKMAVSWKTGVTLGASRLDDFAQVSANLTLTYAERQTRTAQAKCLIKLHHNRGHQGSIVPVRLT